MNHDDIDKHNLIDQFLLGQLSPEAANELQAHARSCRRCLDDLAMAERIQRIYQRDSRHLGGFSGGPYVWWRRQTGLFQGAFIFAAILILSTPAIFISWHLLAVRKQLIASQDSMTQLEEQVLEIATATHHNIPLVRLKPLPSPSADSQPSQQVQLKPFSSMLVLILEVGAPVAGSLKASLEDESGNEVWSSRELLLNEQNEITVGLPTTILLGGNYHLTLQQSAHMLAIYSFDVKYLNP